MVVAIGSAVMALNLTRRSTDSLAGWVAAVTVAGSSLLGWLSVSPLEPKLLVMLFSLLASLALQRRSWLWAGLASGLAGMCWQPAAVVTLCSLAVRLVA